MFVCYPCRRRRLALAGSAVAGALVITVMVVGGTRQAGVVLEQQRSIQDAFPVPKGALKQYLEHTGGSSKLARLNPSMASRIEGQDDWVQHGMKLGATSKGGRGIQSRLQALHMHQMVSRPARLAFASAAALRTPRLAHLTPRHYGVIV